MKKILVSFFVIVLVVALTAAVTWAYFTDTESATTLQLTTADVEVGETTGFPLQFQNITPTVWTDFQTTTINNASTIPVDLYIGLKHIDGDMDFIDPDVLTVEVQRWSGSSWVGTYYGGALDLFASWHKVAEDMPVGETWSYRTRVQLADVDNTYQDKSVENTLFIHAVQWTGGAAPSTAPWEYTP